MKKAVLISCFDWYKRLKIVRELLLNQGYDVTIISSDFDHHKKASIKTKYNEYTYIHVPAYYSNISIQRIMSHLKFGKECKKLLYKESPDLVYCLVPPNNIGNVCAEYRRKHPETKLFVDIIDLWPESMPLERFKHSPPMNVWVSWRTKAIKAADHVFTECDLYQEKLTDVLEKEKVSTLYLYKEQSKEEQTLIQRLIKERDTERRDNLIKFAYLGSMNNIIDIEGICDVLKSFVSDGYKCEIHAIGDGERRQEFHKAINETGCEAYFYGLLFDEFEKIKILTPCDYAFNMMRGVEVGLTMKSIDYLSYGLPLINNIKGDTWRLVEGYGMGMNLGEQNTCISGQYDNIDHFGIYEYFKKKFSAYAFRENAKKVLDIVLK